MTASGAPRAAKTANRERHSSAKGALTTAISVTKREIIEELLARRQTFTHRESETIVNAMFDAMANSLARGDRIEIRGFGSFAVKQRRARQGRNPKTGQLVSVDAKKIPFFRAGKELRIEVNGAEEASR
jgi:integration host factor beta subunit